MKAMTVVRTPTHMGPATPRAPRIAASRAPLPFSRSAAMFSPTTTASSTTMPTSMNRAKIVNTFRVRPAGPKNNNAPMNAMGMPKAIQKAMRRSNMTTRQTNTSATPASPFCTTVSKRSETGLARSSHTSMATSWGTG